MRQYLDIVRHVLENGVEKYPTRRNPNTGEWEPVDGGVRTIMCPNVLFSHEMEEGFPLLTTKKVAWKAVRVELEGFIKGITSKKWYQERGCKIWNEWANPKVVDKLMSGIKFINSHAQRSYRKKMQFTEDDLGTIYGFQWRRFGQCYDENDNGWTDEAVSSDADQLGRIVDTLLNNPMDRRMVCSAWNPIQMSRMALPPCHWGWNVTVSGDGKLHLFWVQRSCDLALGVPFNIASYALLLSLLAQTANLKPGNLSGMLVDCHIYENQIEGLKLQLEREPRPLPHIVFRNNSGNLKKAFNIFDWTYQDVDLVNYNPYPKIDFGGVVV